MCPYQALNLSSCPVRQGYDWVRWVHLNDAHGAICVRDSLDDGWRVMQG
jgi:hypothetical protein